MKSSSPPAPEAQFRSRPLQKDYSSLSQGAIRDAGSSFGSQRAHTAENSQRITYARDRSFLAEPTDDMAALLAQPLTTPEMKRSKDGQSATNLGLAEDGAMNSMRSIHDLRASGDSRLFTDEMDTMMEDIEDTTSTSFARRRNGLIELAKRLTDDDFRARFTHSGYEYRIFSGCADVQDPIVGYALSAAISTILAFSLQAKPTVEVELLTMKSLVNMLDFVKDIEVIGRERARNMSKSAQIILTDFKHVVKQLPLWDGVVLTFMSPRLLALRALDELVRASRSSSMADPATDKAVEKVTMVKIVDIMEHHLKVLPSAPKQYVTSYGVELELALSILETYTLSPDCCADEELWTDELLAQLINSIDHILSMKIELGPRTKFLCLRLCLNLANNNQRNSDAFNIPSLITSLMDHIATGLKTTTEQLDLVDGVQELDMLILALGTMINLAEWSSGVRETVLHSSSGQLDDMVATFTKNRELSSQADSLEESHANVTYGYLAVLLGNLCHEAAVRKRVVAKLPGGLGMVVEAVEEFIAHHKAADRQGEAKDVWSAFTERLQAVAEGLKRVQG